MRPPSDTIFALSSGRPPAAIAVVRISGPAARRALETLAGRVPAPRQAGFATLKDASGQAIDEAVILFFPGPHSATGEDVAELQVHGSRAVLAALIRALGAIEGLRAAQPGEFTRRAFENGKLDLTAAEALADLIDADTEMQRRQALRQLKGFLGPRVEDWRAQLIAASALIEAGIDFSDEGDVPQDLMVDARLRIAALRDEIQETLGTSAHSERLRDGLVVAIVGPPNAGKSTLMNRLARRDVAIVSPHAGTTRDVIEVHLDLAGYPVTLLDTAGLRDTDDPVEREGVRRARDRAAQADLALFVVDHAGAIAQDALDATGAPLWLLQNKIDVAAPPGAPIPAALRTFRISAASGEGIDALTAALSAHARQAFGGTENGIITRARHRERLGAAAASLEAAISAKGDELVAEHLRIAVRSLGQVVGRVDVEDILDSIFKEFCIGK